MKKEFNLAGIGLGPFNLSLAALLERVPNIEGHFFERREAFGWHSEIMFNDSFMQTSFLKDLVTGVDPTNPYSFLNYLVQHGLFHSFMNTDRVSISRREFEIYCQWVVKQISHRISFDSDIQRVSFSGEGFTLETEKESYRAQNLCIGTGPIPRIPDCARPFIGPRVFHAKSQFIKNLDLTGLNIAVVGGGQTGLEIFRNALSNRWGKVRGISLISERAGLEPLDNSPFTNEYFTPSYVGEFLKVHPDVKARIIEHQKMASDGNTPEYLNLLYNDLYQIKVIEGDQRPIEILPYRSLRGINPQGDFYRLDLFNHFMQEREDLNVDLVILCTGFETKLPAVFAPLFERLRHDSHGRPVVNSDFSLEWDGPTTNKIFAVNFSRHSHGISEPQTSLMAWRSGTIINSLTGTEFYPTTPTMPNFARYGTRPQTSSAPWEGELRV